MTGNHKYHDHKLNMAYTIILSEIKQQELISIFEQEWKNEPHFHTDTLSYTDITPSQAHASRTNHVSI